MEEKIIFEITETTAISSISLAKRLMHDLRKMGYRFALDDFGTGLSSLNYLKEFPVSFLKIDKHFISHLDEKSSDFILVKSIGDIASALGIGVIAEGVETEKVYNLLHSNNINSIQGFYLQRPEMWKK